MMRAALLPQTRKAQFEQDILLMFLNAKKAWEAKDEDEDEDEDEGDEDDEDVDYQIYKMTRQAKKSKKKEEDALSRVLGAFLGKFRSWKEVCKTKEVFIDQHLYPFLDNIFFQDEQYDYTRSYGVIPCNTNTNTSSKRKMKATASPSPSSSSAAAAKTTTKSRTIDTAKPDFFLFRPSDDEEFGLLCVKVKKPGCSVTQSLSDRSKLALEMKRSIDHQAILGIQSPKCFGILVDGLVVSSFAAQLSSCGIYSVLELEEFSLLRGKSDLGILPDIVLSFCWIKNLVDEAAAMMTKRRRTTSGSSRLLRPTVALPVQKRSCE
ncbi:hypothetical protein EDC96DRAFT_515074 [Choanephora cucurbitarum]|nr:hypothetical protein EDC96DRAFT_515074 [Choanephora cucurbitarum]